MRKILSYGRHSANCDTHIAPVFLCMSVHLTEDEWICSLHLSTSKNGGALFMVHVYISTPQS